MWALIEQGKTVMHYENTTFIYHNEFSKYTEVEGATLEDIFDFRYWSWKILIRKRKEISS